MVTVACVTRLYSCARLPLRSVLVAFVAEVSQIRDVLASLANVKLLSLFISSACRSCSSARCYEEQTRKRVL